LLRGTEKLFFQALKIAADGDHEAWLLSSIHDQLLPAGEEGKDFPLLHDVGRVLPWWAKIQM
jgi:hypothetical protein